MIEKFLDQFYRRRRLSLVVATCLFVGLAYFWTRLELEDSYERWMPQSAVRAWEEFYQRFPIGDTIVIGLKFDRPVNEGDAPRLRQLRSELTKLPFVEAAGGEASPTVSQTARPVFARVLDCSKVADEIEAVSVAGLVSPEQGERFAFYRGGLFDNSGRTLVTVCEMGEYSGAELNPARRQAVAGIHRAIDTVKPGWSGVEFHVAGGAVVQFELERMGRELVAEVVIPLLVLSIVALWLGFRTWVGVAVCIVAGLWSVGVLMGSIGAAGMNLNAMTVGAPALMAVIVLATAVHFLHHAAVYPELDDRRIVRWVAVPCFGAAGTAGAGFLMLGYNDLAPIRELGLELSVGCILAFFGVVLATLAMPLRRAAGGRWLSHQRLVGWYRGVTRWPKTVVVGSLVGLVVFTGVMQRLRVDADPFSFFKRESEVAKALRMFSQADFGLYPLHVLLVPKDKGNASNGEAISKCVEALKARREVLKVVSSREFDQRALSFSLAGLRRVMAFKDTFASFFDRTGQGAIRITALARDAGEGFGELVEAAHAAAPPKEQFDTYFTGAVAEIVILSDGLIKGLSAGLGTAIVMMTIVCGFLFRSLRLGLLALVPNIFPVLAVYGVMGVLDIPLSSGTAMVATIALGVVLNDTIHFVLQYRRRYEAGEGSAAAIAETYAEVGRPVVLIGVVTCVGFAVFLLSDFLPLFHFGLLTSIAMLAAITGDMIIMPNLLLVLGFKDRPAPPAIAARHVRPIELAPEAASGAGS